RSAFGDPDERLRAWWVAFDGRIALAEGRAADALRIHDELAIMGQRALMPEVRLEAALGRAQALEALGRSAATRSAWDEADRLLDEWSRAVPLGEGRDQFVA